MNNLKVYCTSLSCSVVTLKKGCFIYPWQYSISDGSKRDTLDRNTSWRRLFLVSCEYLLNKIAKIYKNKIVIAISIFFLFFWFSNILEMFTPVSRERCVGKGGHYFFLKDSLYINFGGHPIFWRCFYRLMRGQRYTSKG